MRSPKLEETAIRAALQSAESGRPVRDVCRAYGISAATFYRWKRRYGTQRNDLPRHPHVLEAQVQHLIAVVTRQERELERLARSHRGELQTAADKRAAVQDLIAAHGFSERRACTLLGVNRATVRYSRRD